MPPGLSNMAESDTEKQTNAKDGSQKQSSDTEATDADNAYDKKCDGDCAPNEQIIKNKQGNLANNLDPQNQRQVSDTFQITSVKLNREVPGDTNQEYDESFSDDAAFSDDDPSKCEQDKSISHVNDDCSEKQQAEVESGQVSSVSSCCNEPVNDCAMYFKPISDDDESDSTDVWKNIKRSDSVHSAESDETAHSVPSGNEAVPRFKLVRVEKKDPYKRGRWTAKDFYDPGSQPHLNKAKSTSKADGTKSDSSPNGSSKQAPSEASSVDTTLECLEAIGVPKDLVTQLQVLSVSTSSVRTANPDEPQQSVGDAGHTDGAPPVPVPANGSAATPSQLASGSPSSPPPTSSSVLPQQEQQSHVAHTHAATASDDTAAAEDNSKPAAATSRPAATTGSSSEHVEHSSSKMPETVDAEGHASVELLEESLQNIPAGPPATSPGNHEESATAAQIVSADGTVAIDNKIEQAMDLVKSHLMYAVREEVEVLKDRIQELVQEKKVLEVENYLLKQKVDSDTLTLVSQIQQQQQPAQPPPSPSPDPTQATGNPAVPTSTQLSAEATGTASAADSHSVSPTTVLPPATVPIPTLPQILLQPQPLFMQPLQPTTGATGVTVAQQLQPAAAVAAATGTLLQQQQIPVSAAAMAAANFYQQAVAMASIGGGSMEHYQTQPFYASATPYYAAANPASWGMATAFGNGTAAAIMPAGQQPAMATAATHIMLPPPVPTVPPHHMATAILPGQPLLSSSSDAAKVSSTSSTPQPAPQATTQPLPTAHHEQPLEQLTQHEQLQRQNMEDVKESCESSQQQQAAEQQQGTSDDGS